MPSDQAPDLITAFNEAAPCYDAVGVDFFGPMGAELVRRAGIAAGEHVLDVGCGRGAVLRPAAAAAGPAGRVTGIDLAPEMVALTAADLPDVTVAVGDAQAPDFPPESFDVVTAGLVLFLLPDPPAAVAAYRRLLRPGGRLAFSLIAASDPRHRRAVRALAAHTDPPVPPPVEHEMFADERRLRAAFAGWSDVRISEDVVVSRFADDAQWLRWVGSHGGRLVTRRIPADRMAAATADAAAILDQARTDDGRLVLTTTMRIVVARP
jgi:ubiquinone/menaquinone biosynthesis C-methylase UbiE